MQPDNLSLLNPNGFKFVIDRIPEVEYFTQDCPLPFIRGGNIEIGNLSPFKANYPGERLERGLFQLKFLADEDFMGWKSIYDWIVYNATHNGSDRFVSDGSLIVLTNAKNPNKTFRLRGMYPVEVSEMQFTTTRGAEPLTFNATFQYQYFYLDSGWTPPWDRPDRAQ